MLWAICYDVTDDRRRRRVMEALQDFGDRVQYSVFECALDEAGMAELWSRLGRELDAGEDSCRAYRLCGGCEGEVRILGRGERWKEEPVVIVG